MTIVASEEELTQILNDQRFKDAPDWALKIKHVGVRGAILDLWSRWNPDYEWMEGLIDKYTSAWIKDEWTEQGGNAGVWIGSRKTGEKVIQGLEWEDMCIEEQADVFETKDK